VIPDDSRERCLGEYQPQWRRRAMTSFLVVSLLALNAGFLLGAWWGSGWKRREHSQLKSEVGRLRKALDEAQEPGIIPLFDSTTQVG
jgi:hypothetical protein